MLKHISHVAIFYLSSCVIQSHPVSMVYCVQPTESIITHWTLHNSSELQFSYTKDLDEILVGHPQRGAKFSTNDMSQKW